MVVERPGSDGIRHKHVAGVAFEPCTLSIGVGLAQPLLSWIQDAVAGTFARHNVFLTRTDSSGAPALRLDNAIITRFTAPAVTRASTAPAFLSVEITPESLRRVAAPALPAGADLTVHPIDPSSLGLSLNGTALAPASTGPLSLSVNTSAPVGEVRDPSAPADTTLGDLSARVRESQTSAITALDSFLNSFVISGTNGQSDEVPIVETLGDGGANTLSLTLNQGGMAKGDLAPRADGTRRYAFYGETLTLAQ